MWVKNGVCLKPYRFCNSGPISLAPASLALLRGRNALRASLAREREKIDVPVRNQVRIARGVC